ncbi:MAG: hypothetical protein IT178_08475 [Acidobacteria bacterium]|nr:hypothetical protein [Acidobacteriota bacterium]
MLHDNDDLVAPLGDVNGGTSLGGLTKTGAETNRAWPGIPGGFFPVVAEEFLRQGFTAEDIGKVGGGNFARVFGQVSGS